MTETKAENKFLSYLKKARHDYFDKKITFSEAVDRIKINTRQYAKRQMTWLRKNDDYRWFKIDEIESVIVDIENIINGDNDIA